MQRSSAKAKGKRLAFKVKELFKKHLNLQDEDIIIPRGSLKGADLILSDEAKECLPFKFELKNQEKLNIWAAIEQAKRHEGSSLKDLPAVIFARNHCKPQICLDLEDYLKLLKDSKNS